MSDNDKIVELPTGYQPDLTISRDEIVALHAKIDLVTEELHLVSKLINQLLRGLAAERRNKK